jgi:hypothetical protein
MDKIVCDQREWISSHHGRRGRFIAHNLSGSSE